MKKLLYIGNKLEAHGAAPTSADTLPPLLEKEGFEIKSVSSFKNKVSRFLHMIVATLLGYKRVDVVLIDTYSTSNFWYAVTCGFICKTLKFPYIFILHGGNLDQRFQNTSSRILGVFRSARRNVVPSDYLFKELHPYFKNIELIPNWIDLKSYSFKQRKEIEPKLLWVRSFDKVYNPILAIKVLQELLKDYPEATLCMVGPEKDGSLARCKAMVHTYNLPVTFTGKLPKEEWKELAKNYDIFLNTTFIDNTPVSLIEAMALGIPVISTKVGGIPFLLENEENGILVEPDDVVQMTGAVKRLLNDPELTHHISTKAYKEIKKYDWGKVRLQWLELLN